MSSERPKEAARSDRIEMADPAGLNDAQLEVYRKIVNGKRGKIVGPLRVALHSPELAGRWEALGEFLRFQTELPVVINELAIITTGRYWNCQVEWFIHSAIAEEVGLSPGIIEAIRTAQPPEFDDALQAGVYAFTRELLRYGQANDDVYHTLLGMLGVKSIVELTAVIGYYSMVAMTLNVHHVPLPESGSGSFLDLPRVDGLAAPTHLPEGRGPG